MFKEYIIIQLFFFFFFFLKKKGIAIQKVWDHYKGLGYYFTSNGFPLVHSVERELKNCNVSSFFANATAIFSESYSITSERFLEMKHVGQIYANYNTPLADQNQLEANNNINFFVKQKLNHLHGRFHESRTQVLWLEVPFDMREQSHGSWSSLLEWAHPDLKSRINSFIYMIDLSQYQGLSDQLHHLNELVLENTYLSKTIIVFLNKSDKFEAYIRRGINFGRFFYGNDMEQKGSEEEKEYIPPEEVEWRGLWKKGVSDWKAGIGQVEYSDNRSLERSEDDQGFQRAIDHHYNVIRSYLTRTYSHVICLLEPSRTNAVLRDMEYSLGYYGNHYWYGGLI
ncbi:hypothetical protein RFI_13933 [Reticulomyxa filosa]|uniref:Uncharacterized protein n=1 Tax=Reticulomyxa filosa TaxID=46433 RepID=X6NBH5_RETFI|nr:hypothetical protein RFI_13933 [Reticulomyxa filosa]|eukprot:ETO23248.1 hypothetical protein RFI_13933 [Reticulomyxa filosa]